VDAYTRNGRKLKVVGTGTEYAALTAKAGPNIEFLGRKSDPELLALYRRCRLLVFPGEEDFGIVPLEAQACGRPVVAFGRGGALETIRDGVSGVFFANQTAAALTAAVERCATRSWDSRTIRAHAETFSPQTFINGLDKAIHLTTRART